MAVAMQIEKLAQKVPLEEQQNVRTGFTWVDAVLTQDNTMRDKTGKTVNIKLKPIGISGTIEYLPKKVAMLPVNQFKFVERSKNTTRKKTICVFNTEVNGNILPIIYFS